MGTEHRRDATTRNKEGSRWRGGPVCATLPAPGGPPIIGSTEGLLMIVASFAVAWTVAAAWGVKRVWRSDPRRLGTAVLVTSVLAIGTALALGALRLSDGNRLRAVVEDSLLYCLAALLVVAPVALAWAVRSARDRLSPGTWAAGHSAHARLSFRRRTPSLRASLRVL